MVKRAVKPGGGGTTTVTTRDRKGVCYGLTSVPCVDNATRNDILTRKRPPTPPLYILLLYRALTTQSEKLEAQSHSLLTGSPLGVSFFCTFMA
jgi:hypothetical protein